jgi:hypothetical protein
MIDETTETGLPVVEPGYFWRIKKWNYELSSHSLMIQLRRRRRFGSALVGDMISTHGAEEIHRTCRRIIENTAMVRAKNATLHDRDKFVGDYPPKSLPCDTPPNWGSETNDNGVIS